MDKRYGILIICAVILVLSFVGTASARTWYVDDDGGADFTGVQNAINNASVGDTIIVYSGVYYENVVVNKSVTLKGIGIPVVDARGSDSAITLTADGITVEGFNVTNSRGDAGIEVISSNNNLTGNTVSNNVYGIYLWDSSNNNITGNNASNNFAGIRLGKSSNNDIAGNNLDSNNYYGIGLEEYSNHNTITGNTVSNNDDYGIRLEESSNNTIACNTFVNDGLFVDSSYKNTVEDNIVNGKPLVYLEDASDCKVTDAGQVILVNCNNITVENLDLSNTHVGIELWKTEDSMISNNDVRNNEEGIHLKESRNNNITGNNVSNNMYGICLEESSNNNIIGNNVSNNDYTGIRLDESSSNNIACNNLGSEWVGLWDSSNNTITGNNISCISLGNSSNNTITGNNISCISLRYSSNNNSITDNTVTTSNNWYENWYEDWYGISLRDSSNNTITRNIIKGNNVSTPSKEYGIYLVGSSNNNIAGNTFVNTGLFVYRSYKNAAEDNTVNGKPLVYLEDASHYKVEDAGQVILVNCNNISVENLDLSCTCVGIVLWKTEDSIIANNNVSNNNDNGIYLQVSNNNIITSNTVSNNGDNGIYLNNSNNNIIAGNNVSKSWCDISLRESSNNNIKDNNVGNSLYGIRLSESSNNNIAGNAFVNTGLFVDSFYKNTVEDNIVNGKPLVYLKDASDYKIDDAGQVILVNCNNITVENLDLSENTCVGIVLWDTEGSMISNNSVQNNNDGILLHESSNNTIKDNNVSKNNGNGIILRDSSNNTIKDNNACNNSGRASIRLVDSSNNSITSNNLCFNGDGIVLHESNNNIIRGINASSNNWYGISLFDSSNNSLKGNNATNNEYGICLWDSSNNNTFSDNNATNNEYGICLWDSSNNNTFSGNNVSNNNNAGISLGDSSNNNTIRGSNICNNEGCIGLYESCNNKIYLNNFIGNRDNVKLSNSTNIWNSTEKITYTYDESLHTNYMGNYWDDYNGTDANSDGIGDNPYIIRGDNPDIHPLTAPFENYVLLAASAPTPPGFEILFAIAALFAVAYVLLIWRRE